MRQNFVHANRAWIQVYHVTRITQPKNLVPRSKGVLCSPQTDTHTQTHRHTQKWLQSTPFLGFRNFSSTYHQGSVQQALRQAAVNRSQHKKEISSVKPPSNLSETFIKCSLKQFDLICKILAYFNIGQPSTHHSDNNVGILHPFDRNGTF